MIVTCRYSVYQYSESCPELDSLFQTLNELGIHVSKEYVPSLRYCSAHFDVIEGTDKDKEIYHVIDKIRQLDQVSVGTHYSVRFSESEIETADYLHIRSVYAGLDAKNKYLELQHDSGLCDKFLGNTVSLQEHVVQIEQPHITKRPIWHANRQFCSNYQSGMSNLFCSDKARSVLEDTHIEGVGYLPVFQTKTKIQVPDLWQLWPLEAMDFLSPGDGTKTRFCPVCSARRYVTTDERSRLLLVGRLLPPGLDCFQSPPLVGANTGYPYYVISSKMYRVLKQADILGGLIFEPVEVI